MPTTLNVTSAGASTALPELAATGILNVANDGPNPVFVGTALPGTTPTLAGATMIAPLMIGRIPCGSFGNVLTAITASGQTPRIRVSSPALDPTAGRAAAFGPALMAAGMVFAGAGVAGEALGQKSVTNPASFGGGGAFTAQTI